MTHEELIATDATETGLIVREKGYTFTIMLPDDWSRWEIGKSNDGRHWYAFTEDASISNMMAEQIEKSWSHIRRGRREDEKNFWTHCVPDFAIDATDDLEHLKTFARIVQCLACADGNVINGYNRKHKKK